MSSCLTVHGGQEMAAIKEITVFRFNGQLFTSQESKQRYQLKTFLAAAGIATGGVVNIDQLTSLIVNSFTMLQAPTENVTVYETSDGARYNTMADATTAQSIINARNQVPPKPAVVL